MAEDFLNKKIDERKEQNSFRQLSLSKDGMIDFCSNDYLGIVKNDLLNPSGRFEQPDRSGATGSRLLTGNYKLIEETEQFIANFHNAESGLIFNSGYDANVGLLSCVPQRGDTVLYDYLSHASIRDGIRLSFAQSFSFQHNDLNDVEERLKKSTGNIFVVTESVFSMDGDLCPLKELVTLCEKYKANLIIDEAHATGIIGEKGEGLVQTLNLESKIFARIHTFGKAIGVHGAIVLGSTTLRDYLINFARSFIYSTALPPAAIAQVKAGYELFPSLTKERDQLKKLIKAIRHSSIKDRFMASETPIQGVIIQGNEQAKKAARLLQDNNIDVRPILYPTVPKNQERLRIVLHSFNSENELDLLLDLVEKCF